jgi:exonuclease III
MIVCSWNVRGLGGRVKKQKLCQLIYKQKVDVMAVQETKLEIVDQNLCARLWGGIWWVGDLLRH